MQGLVAKYAWRALRVASLVILAIIGTTSLVRFAPGYFTDSREMDAQHGSVARAEMAQRRSAEESFATYIVVMGSHWVKGDLGTSRQYDAPVAQLVRERAAVTGKLLVKSVFLGWLLSFAAALPLSSRRARAGERLVLLSSTALLCVPIALLATVCLVLDCGGPVFVLSSLIAIRDFKILYRVLSNGVRSPSVLFARAQGYSFVRAVKTHLLLALKAEFLALLMASLVVALSAIVPVEVIFDRPGLGQLAWSAAMNRDLPTLLPITSLIAALIGTASMVAESETSHEVSACA